MFSDARSHHPYPKEGWNEAVVEPIPDCKQNDQSLPTTTCPAHALASRTCPRSWVAMNFSLNRLKGQVQSCVSI